MDYQTQEILRCFNMLDPETQMLFVAFGRMMAASNEGALIVGEQGAQQKQK